VLVSEGALQVVLHSADQGCLTTAFDYYLVPGLFDLDGVLSADVFGQSGEVDNACAASAGPW